MAKVLILVVETQGNYMAICGHCHWDGEPQKHHKDAAKELVAHVKSAAHCDLREQQNRYNLPKKQKLAS